MPHERSPGGFAQNYPGRRAKRFDLNQKRGGGERMAGCVEMQGGGRSNSLAKIRPRATNAARSHLVSSFLFCSDKEIVTKRRVSDQGGNDHVAARPAVEDVLAAVADQDVIAVTAEERIVAGAADQHVVAVAAIEHEVRPAKADARSLNHIVTAKTLDLDRVAEVEVLDHNLTGQPVDHHRAVDERKRDHIVTGRAVDRDDVRRTVRSRIARNRGEIDVDLLYGSAGHVADVDRVGATARIERD